jgi:hypothetical protein
MFFEDDFWFYRVYNSSSSAKQPIFSLCTSDGKASHAAIYGVLFWQDVCSIGDEFT